MTWPMAGTPRCTATSGRPRTSPSSWARRGWPRRRKTREPSLLLSGGMKVITLKLATSLDGRIATAGGESRWITGAVAREAVHRLRAAHDAGLVGAEPALAADPELAVRLPGYGGAQPGRGVLDAPQRPSPPCQL